VPKSPSAWTPRWTPTSTLSARSFLAQPTLSCQRRGGTPAGGSAPPRVVTLCVAQAIMGIPSDRRFHVVARKRLGHPFPDLPRQAGYFKRRRRLADAIEWLMAHFAQQSPGFADDLLLIDSTPVESARSRETAQRSALSEVAGYGYCAAHHSRYFLGSAPARPLRPRRYPESARADFALARPTRGRPRAASALPQARRRDAALRQGLRRP